jgi:hypothetical protein
MPVQNKIQFRRGTAGAGASQWTNQVLSAGEVGYETDTGRFKIGDGITAWDSLEYAAVAAADFVAGSGIQLTAGSNGSTLTVAVTGLALSGHTHTASNITDFNSAVSGLLPVTNISAGSGISVNNNSGNFTISLSDPTIQVGDITDFVDGVNDRVADLLTAGSNIQLTYTDSGNDTSTLSIAVTGVSLSGHTHTLSNITDVTASATEVNYLDGSVPGTGVAGAAVILDSNLNITNLGNVSTTGTLTVGGNLIVNGSTTTVNSTVTTIDDPILTLGGDTAPSSDDNKDRGIEFRYYNGSAKTGFFGYDDSTGKFTFIPDATNTSEVFSGTKGELDANVDWSNILSKPDPVIAVDITGDVSGSGNLTMTDLAGGTISINTTIGANSVALGTDTTGDYVAAVTVSGVGLSVTGSGENATYNISSNATSSNTVSTIVARDSSGNFTASTITASGLTGASAGSPVTISYAVIDGGTP